MAIRAICTEAGAFADVVRYRWRCYRCDLCGDWTDIHTAELGSRLHNQAVHDERRAVA